MTQRSEPVYYVTLRPIGKKGERVDVTDRVLSFEYEDSESKNDKLKLSLNNLDLAVFDDPNWRKGNLLTVTWGYVGNLAPPRDVVIQKITGSTMLTVEAHGKAVLMHKKTKSRHFDALRRSDIVRQIATENGYGQDLQDIEDTQVVLPTIIQASLTDATFLKRLAHLEGFEFYVDFDGFHFHQKRLGQKPLRTLEYYTDPKAGDIVAFNIDTDVSFGKPGAVTVSGRDPLNKKDIKSEANNANTQRPALAPVPEASVDPVSGALSFSTTNVSTETRATTETSAKAAEREAAGQFRRAQNAAVKMTVDIVGDPRLPAKSVIEIRGIGKRFSGKYYVKDHKHTIDSSGYKSKLTLSSNGSSGTTGQKATASGADVNKKTPDKDGGQLQQSLVIDPVSGAKSIAYRDTGGRGT